LNLLAARSVRRIGTDVIKGHLIELRSEAIATMALFASLMLGLMPALQPLRMTSAHWRSVSEKG
jgi:hypothetical protein